MEEKELLERLARIEHSQWRFWRENMERRHPEIDSSKFLRMPYSKLPEKEKEEDRKWAREVIGLLKKSRVLQGRPKK